MTTLNRTAPSDDELAKPLAFVGSAAHSYVSSSGRTGHLNADKPTWQPLVVSVSMIVFMIYFFILREENDIDEKISNDAPNTMANMEVQQLKTALRFNLANGIPVEVIKERLAELGEVV